MNAVHKILALNTSFPAAEQRAADYIVKHADQIPFLSVQAIARSVGINAASVCRMVQRAGFADFRELKVALARETADPVSAVHQAVTAEDSDSQIVQNVFRGNIGSIEDTLKALRPADLTRAAQVIMRAKGVVFFGVGSSGSIAQDAALRLAHLGINAEARVDEYQMVVRAVQLTKGHVAVGISHSGRSAASVHALECAREAGAVTIGISNYLRSPLQRACSIFFCTAFRDTGFEATAVSAGVAQICLMDALYVLVARHLPVGAKAKEVNQAVEKFCRLSERNDRKQNPKA